MQADGTNIRFKYPPYCGPMARYFVPKGHTGA
jgi:hypothetical protein